jgi:class 3 adenylate cyclase/CHASE2 domain-containing sensor protein
MIDLAASVPFRKGRGRLADAIGAVAVALVIAAACVLAVEHVAFLTAGERFIEDLQIAFEAPPAAQDSDILILAVNEDTLRQFPYRAPIDRAFLSRLLAALDAKHPRAIGLDYLLDQPTEPQKDAQLRQALHTMKTPLVVSYLENSDNVSGGQVSYLNGFVPPADRAFANIGTDQTDTVRWILPGGRDAHGHFLLSLPRALAAKAGVKSPDRQISIAWHGDGGRNSPAFAETPAHVEGAPGMTMADILPASIFRNKIVLIGSDMTLIDRHRTPFATDSASDKAFMPGVVVLAHEISQLLDHRNAPEPQPGRKYLVAMMMALTGALLGAVGLPLWLRLSLLALLMATLWFVGIFLLFGRFGIMLPLLAPTMASTGAFAAMDALAGRAARQQRKFIQGAFARYVSPKLVEQMVEDPSRMSLKGERRVMTYLFSDIQNFTTMSEKMESHTLSALLNAYLDGMTAIVLKHDGMVDKFIGDSVMAVFNAPLDLADHAQKAVRCMLEMDDFCERFRKDQQAAGIPLGVTRIGVHTGAAVIGNFGSQDRFTYTAQGDAVNTASRLEGINKYLGTRLCVSDATRILCRDITFRPVASVVLKGKTEALDLWEPLHEAALGADILAAYGAAYDRLRQGAPDAAAMFQDLSTRYPDDPCILLHAGRLKDGATGVTMVMTEK